MKLAALKNAPRSHKVLVWAGAAVLLLAATVQTTGAGIDLLALAVVCLILLAIERIVGDWVAELVGPIGAAVFFAVLGFALSWYFLVNEAGRTHSDRFFLEAERRGYKTWYYQARSEGSEPTDSVESTAASTSTPPPASPVAPASSPAANAPAAEANAATEAARNAGGRVSKLAKSLFRREPAPAPAPTTIRLSISPGKLEVPYTATLKATVLAGEAPVGFGNVDFTANGLGAGRVRLAADGTAATTFVPRIAGSYEFRARFTGTDEHAASISRPLVVEAAIRK